MDECYCGKCQGYEEDYDEKTVCKECDNTGESLYDYDCWGDCECNGENIEWCLNPIPRDCPLGCAYNDSKNSL